MKRALITGISGQDGSYLAEYLLSRGYEVNGLTRSSSEDDVARRLGRASHLRDQVTLHRGSLDDPSSIRDVFANNPFDECYHLAARTFVPEGVSEGYAMMSTNVNGTYLMLATILELQPRCRFFFAGSSEMFGRPAETPQNEETGFRPRNVYGVSKVAGHWLTVNHREAHGLHACSGVLFNHVSPRSGTGFLPRKVTRGAARIALGLQDELRLGDLEARRDWGHAKDFVRAMHAMLQRDTPADFVIGTGRTFSVRELTEIAFAELGLDYRRHVVVDERYVRPTERERLQADPTRAREVLGWKPEHTFEGIVKEMVRADLREAEAEAAGASESEHR